MAEIPKIEGVQHPEELPGVPKESGHELKYDPEHPKGSDAHENSEVRNASEARGAESLKADEAANDTNGAQAHPDKAILSDESVVPVFKALENANLVNHRGPDGSISSSDAEEMLNKISGQ